MERFWYLANVITVVDGDTIDVDANVGFSVHVHERLRLSGINTPEIHGVSKESSEYQAGMEAKEFLESMIGGKDVLIKTIKDRKGKYGRYLAEVYLPNKKELKLLKSGKYDESNETSINEIMIDKGFAEEYEK